MRYCMAKHLTKKQLLMIHEELCKKYGEDASILSDSQLDLIIEAPKRVIFDYEPYVTICEKAGALMHEGLKLHPFLQANKRTAFLAVRLFLEQNDWRLHVRDSDEIDVCIRTAQCCLNITELSEWIRSNSSSV